MTIHKWILCTVLGFASLFTAFSSFAGPGNIPHPMIFDAGDPATRLIV